jgi:hypothetical protein
MSKFRRSKKCMPKPTNVGRHGKLVMLAGCSERGFHIMPEEPPPPEFEALVNLHSDRLRALLDKPVILAVHWDEGDAAAIVQIMPTDRRDPAKPFEELTLPFPVVLPFPGPPEALQ